MRQRLSQNAENKPIKKGRTAFAILPYDRLFELLTHQDIELRRVVGRIRIGELIVAGRNFCRRAKIGPLVERQHNIGSAQDREAGTRNIAESQVEGAAAAPARQLR
jgi:hypothetical protein